MAFLRSCSLGVKALLFSFFVCAVPIQAQVIRASRVIASSNSSPVVVTSSSPTQAGTPAQVGTPAVAGQAAAETAPPENVLLTKLLAAKFERTPQSILKAWSYREPDKDSVEETEAPEFAATLSNKFGSVLVFEFEEPTKFTAKQLLVLKEGEVELGRRRS